MKIEAAPCVLLVRCLPAPEFFVAALCEAAMATQKRARTMAEDDLDADEGGGLDECHTVGVVGAGVHVERGTCEDGTERLGAQGFELDEWGGSASCMWLWREDGVKVARASGPRKLSSTTAEGTAASSRARTHAA